MKYFVNEIKDNYGMSVYYNNYVVHVLLILKVYNTCIMMMYTIHVHVPVPPTVINEVIIIQWNPS